MACVLLVGCGADLLLGLADALGTASDGLNTVGTCLSDVEYTNLDDIFDLAVDATWTDGAVILTDEAQDELDAFYEASLPTDVIPLYRLNERFYRVQAPASGQAVRVDFVSNVAEWAYVYDGQHRQLAVLRAYNFDGQLRSVVIPPLATDSFYVRIILAHLSSTGEPLVSLSAVPATDSQLPRTQTVVLNMSGYAGLTFRTGILTSTTVAPVDDPIVREAVVRMFTEIYAPYDMLVLTDADAASEGPYTTIHIGAADPSFGYNGLSEWVDGLNQAQDDAAIVDTTSDHLQLAALFGADAQGTAIGLVAAHEMGHLLGLEHTVDPDDLMTGMGCEGTGLDFERFIARRFRTADVQAVFSAAATHAMGHQDPDAHLLSVLGPAENTAE
jgi:hypothetical protein